MKRTTKLPNDDNPQGKQEKDKGNDQSKGTHKKQVKVGRRCITCSSEKRLEIDRAIVQGVPVAELSRRYGIGYDSLSRHRDNCISRQMVKHAEIVEKTAVETICADISDVYDRIVRLLDRAEKDGRTMTFLEACKEMRAFAELLLKIEASFMKLKGDQVEPCPCGGTYQVIDVSGLSEFEFAKLHKALALAKDPDTGKPIAATPVRDTLH